MMAETGLYTELQERQLGCDEWQKKKKKSKARRVSKGQIMAGLVHHIEESGSREPENLSGQAQGRALCQAACGNADHLQCWQG